MAIGKTVYILGAGFSKEAGIPLQGDLLPQILETEFDSDLAKHKDTLELFIYNIFGLKGDQAKKLDLEDIYTPINQSISKDEYIKSYPPSELKAIETSINILIAHIIEYSKGKKNYINTFVNYLINDKKKAPTTDHIAVISLNWDTVVDDRLFKGKDIVVNYGCNTTGIDNDKMIPVLTAKERNACYSKLTKEKQAKTKILKIIKLLKLI